MKMRDNKNEIDVQFFFYSIFYYLIIGTKFSPFLSVINLYRIQVNHTMLVFQYIFKLYIFFIVFNDEIKNKLYDLFIIYSSKVLSGCFSTIFITDYFSLVTI